MFVIRMVSSGHLCSENLPSEYREFIRKYVSAFHLTKQVWTLSQGFFANNLSPIALNIFFGGGGGAGLLLGTGQQGLFCNQDGWL